jgi:hypothetical protein
LLEEWVILWQLKKKKKEDDNENDDKGKMWESFNIAKH